MPSFRWSAVNPGGDVARGVMDAPDRAAVVERLQRQGQIVLRADLTAGHGGWADFLQIELGRSRGLDKAALGEVTRELAIMLAAGQDLERERSLSANLRSAMIYPALLIVAALGSIVLLLDYVLPQFAPIFEQAGAELPAATRALMSVGTIVGAMAPWLLVALLAGGVIA